MRKLLLFSIAVIIVSIAFAQTTYYWTGATGGTFATASNWNTNPAGGGSTPATVGGTDIFIIDGAGTTAGAAVTINLGAAQALGQLKITSNTACTLQATSTTTRIITIGGGTGDDFVIENGSTLVLNHASQAVAIAFSGTGNTGDISGTVTFGGSTSNTITTTGGTSTLVTVNATGVVNIGTTAINLVGSTNTLNFANGSNCNVTGATTGAYPIPLATWASNSTVTLSGSSTSATTATNKNQSFGNFVVNLPNLGSTLSFWTSATTASIQGNLIINATGIGIFRALTSGTLTVSGNLVVNGGNFQHTSSTGVFTVAGNTTIGSGGNLDLSNATTTGNFSQRGATFTNNGTLTVGGSTGTTNPLSFYSPTNAPMTFAGTGVIVNTLNAITVQTTGGLTITHTNQIPTLRVNFLGGTITNSNKLTIGTGSTSATTILIGATGVNAGGFDQSPTWNLGTGGHTILYYPQLGNRTTSFEIPPSRSVSNITLDNINGLTIAGGNLNVSGTLTLTKGVITSSASNTLSLGTATAAGTLTSTTVSDTVMIVGPFTRTFAASRTAAGTYDNTTLYPMGIGGRYTPIWVDPTTTSGGAVQLTSQAGAPNGGTAGTGVTNMTDTTWAVSATSGSANLTSAYFRLKNYTVKTTSKLLQSPTATGAFDGVVGGSTSSGAGGTVTSINQFTSFPAYLSYGDLATCSTPADQATNFIPTLVRTTSATISFTGATSTPTGYLVVRGATGFTPTPPTDQSLYASGATLGTGTVVGYYNHASTVSFTSSSLTTATGYDYYIYAFNNSGCAGPVYNVTSPLFGNITTCVAAVSSTAGTVITATSFSANWTAVTNATAYIIDVSKSSTFTAGNYVAGDSALNVGNVTTFSVTGLTPNTTYYYRVRAVMSGCTTDNSANITVATFRTAPWSENFDAGVTVGTTVVGTSSSLPAGWLSQSAKWASSSGTTYNTPRSSANYLTVAYSSTNADVFTPGFYLTSGVTYTIAYWAQTDGYQGWTSGLFYNSSQVSAGATQIGSNYAPAGGIAVTAPATNAYVQVSNTFTPTSSGVYYFCVRGNQSSGSPWYMAFDDFTLQAPCTGPSAPTSMVFGTIGTGTVTATYTANATQPTGYVVVRFPSGATPTAPTTAKTYIATDTVGSNGIVTNVLSSAALGFTAANLSPNTTYDFYLYPYNNTTCTNGPAYGTPLMGTAGTAGCPTYSSTINVNPAATPVAGSVYNSLSAAVLELTGCGVTQPTVIELASNYTSAGETYPIVLRALIGASYSNSITIRPASDASNLTITGASSGSQIFNIDGGNYWVIDGRAGGTGSTKNLTIENTGVLANSTSAIRLINGAQYNTIQYCTLRSSTSSTTSNGVLTFSGSTASVGNSNNKVSDNNIDCYVPTVGYSTSGIASNPTGTSLADARFNSFDTITNNNIYNFFNATNTSHGGGGMLLANGFNSDWVISNNSIYQTQPLGSPAAAADVFGIYVNGVNGGNFKITNNYIGGTAPNCGGTPMTYNSTVTTTFRGMYLSLGSVSPSAISNNTITNISFSTASTSPVSGGISMLNGAGTITNNVIGSATKNSLVFNSTGAATFNAIYAGSGTADHNGLITISNNTISGVTIGGSVAVNFIGIRTITNNSAGTALQTNSQYTITGNTIGSTTVDTSIKSTTNGYFYGIYADSTVLPTTISNNTIANMWSTNATGTGNFMGGIYTLRYGVNNITNNTIYKLGTSFKTPATIGIWGINCASPTAGQTISGNTIYNLQNSEVATATTIAGIVFSGPTTGTNIIEKNKIYNLMLATSSTTGAIYGIQTTAASGYPLVTRNNIIRIGIAADGSSINTGYSIFGINDVTTAGATSHYFNSIYVGSTTVGGATSNTYALYSAGTTNTRIISNNIFSNVRSGGTTGKHYAIGLAGVSSLTINNNDYFTNGSATLAFVASVDQASLTALQTTTTQDNASVSADPNFVDATGATPNLHINNATASLLESAGADVSGITTDIDGDARPGPANSSNGGALVSDIGADEFDGILGKPVITFNSISPSTIQCVATARDITITVNPAGTLTAAPVLTYKVNGGVDNTINMLAGTATLSTTGTWTATIPVVTPANATVTWSISTTNGNIVSYIGTSYFDAVNTGVEAKISYTNNIVCSSNSATSLTASLIGTNATATYCPIIAPSSNLTYINNFTTTGATTNINNTSSFSTNGYGDFSNISAVAQRGTTINFSVGLTGTTVGVAVFVDWNQNGTFESGEKMYATSTYVSTLSSSFVVPTNALLGKTRMRVFIDYYNGAPSNACGPFTTSSSTTRGEVEDYSFTVVPAVTYSWSDGSANIGTTSTITPSPSTTTTYTVTATANSCPLTANQIITVIPAVTSNAGNDITTCGITTATLDATAPSSGTGAWSIATGSPNTSNTQLSSTNNKNAVFTPTATGTYKIVWSITNTPCSIATDTVIVNVNALPTAASITGSSICASPGNDGFITSSTSVIGVNYQLYNASNATVGAAQAGTGSGLTWSGLSAGNGYYAKAIDATTSCASSNSVAVNITSKTAVSITSVSKGSDVCYGGTTNLTANGVAGTGANVTWYDAAGGTGNNLGTGLTLSNVGAGTYYARVTGDCGTPAEASVTVNTITTYTWTGATSNLWNVATNWSCGIVPTSSNDIVIASGTPVMNVDITIPSGKSLIISGSGKLIIASGKSLTIAGSVDFGGKSVTLQSDANGTGRIAAITGTLSNATNVTVERYIPASKKAYRFLTPSVHTSGTIHANWQEGATNSTDNPNPGYGTHITGDVNGANGFDSTTSGNVSMFTFDNSSTNANQSTAWTAINNTDATQLKSGTGYRIYVRGSRAFDLTSLTPTTDATTLRATGSLVTGTVTMSSGSSTVGMPRLSGVANYYSLVGNPYASPISWNALTKTDITNNYYAWDPTQATNGAYVSCDNNGITNNPSSAVTDNIQPGQAFFIQNTSNATAPSLIFQEAHKTSGNTNVFRTLAANAILSTQLLLTINASNNHTQDGITVVFDNNYSNAVTDEDACKMVNPGENIAVERNNKTISIEKRAMPTINDNIPLKMWQLAQTNYTLRFNGSNFAGGISAYLQDSYLSTETPISLTGITDYNFTTNNNAASMAANRFTIVFRTSNALPVSILNVNAASKNAGIELSWNTANEINMDSYEVEESSNAINFIKATTVIAKNNATNNYSWFDAQINNGDNYYRIKFVEKNGTVKYSNVVKVKIGGKDAVFAVYPNPVKEGLLSLQMSNVTAGNYTLQLYNKTGQEVYNTMLKHNGGSASQSINIGKLATGTYHLKISNGNFTTTQNIIVE